MFNVLIGKYTLESLTNGMYSSPEDFYREYIQNAVDSLDEAIDSGIIKEEQAEILISIDTNNKSISILDNGTGILSGEVEKALIDIGNSKKDPLKSRGFRGIGRLAGLGYCDTLEFTTTAKGESVKSIIRFDAKKLKSLLIPGNSSDDSVSNVINQVITIFKQPEKRDLHYFNVKLIGVINYQKILNKDNIYNYLCQSAPAFFSPDFRWGKVITDKFLMGGFSIPQYKITLSFDGKDQDIYKPYTDFFISDRVRRIEENIQDISIKKFVDAEGNVSAILWYAVTNYNGTIINNLVKGIRVRKGNILIGDKTTLTNLFKEERFNGWLFGELHVYDNNLIPNARRDDFEKNEAYEFLIEQFRFWTLEISKKIRKLSCERSLTAPKATIAAAEEEDINKLCKEGIDLSNEPEDTEASLMDRDESFDVAQNEFLDKLNVLLGQKHIATKYTVINLNNKLTNEQKRMLEKVFDIITKEYSKEVADKFINTIAGAFL